MSSVTERLMGLGKWSVTLKSVTPSWILDRFAYFAEIVVTAERVEPRDVGDAGVLAAAIYSGPVTQLPRSDDYKTSGRGNRLWFGDGSGAGDIIETAYVPATPTFVNWWTGLLGTINSVPSPLTAGTLTAITAPAAGELTDSVIDITRLAAAQLVSSYYGGEYRTNPDFTVDAGAAADLFEITPKVVLLREPGGTDPAIRSLRLVNVQLTEDIDDYTTRVVAVGDGGNYRGSDEDTSPYRDPQGNTVRRDRFATVDAKSNTVAAELAAAILDTVDGPRIGLKISVDGFAPGKFLEPGDNLWVYDPRTPELQDTANPFPFHGGTIYPTTIRCLGATWPILDTYGVYLRTHNGTSASYIDLSDYVVFAPDSPATLEVGAVPRSSNPGSFGGAGEGQHVHGQYLEAVAQSDLDMNANAITDANAIELRIEASNPAVSDGPDDYPNGYSRQHLSGATGWPIATGSVETFADIAADRAYQIVAPKTGGLRFVRYWASDTTWSDWQQIESLHRSLVSGTQYTLTATNTFERIATLTESSLPTTSFRAAVLGTAQTSCFLTSTAYFARCRVGVSLDGGSSFVWSGNPRQAGAAVGNNWGSVSAGSRLGGAVTGTIQIALDGYADQLVTYDEHSLQAVIGPNY